MSTLKAYSSSAGTYLRSKQCIELALKTPNYIIQIISNLRWFAVSDFEWLLRSLDKKSNLTSIFFRWVGENPPTSPYSSTGSLGRNPGPGTEGPFGSVFWCVSFLSFYYFLWWRVCYSMLLNTVIILLDWYCLRYCWILLIYLYFEWKSDRFNKHAHGVSKFFCVFKVFLSCFSKTVPRAPRLGRVWICEVRRGLSVEKALEHFHGRSLITHNIEVTETEPLTKRDLLSKKQDPFPTQLLQV